LRSDLERKALFHVDETVPLSTGGYSSDINHEVYAALGGKARTVLRAGHSVVIDAVYPRAEERHAIEGVAAELRVPFHGIWLQAAPDKLIARVSARQGDASDADASIVRRQLAADVGPLSGPWHALDANGSREEVCIRASGILEMES
jgi:hypothetical protein